EAIARYFADTGLRNNVYVISTETEDPAATAHVRMFSLDLGAGVREDPATGGAAGPAAAYLLRHGLAAPGTLLLEQGVEMGRPSLLRVTVEADGSVPTRVRVAGGVVLVAEGTLYAPA
ncbi:MAG: PhzF family phenazine biosynthesis protein, partial [Dehalococcoidia bacterium]